MLIQRTRLIKKPTAVVSAAPAPKAETVTEAPRRLRVNNVNTAAARAAKIAAAKTDLDELLKLVATAEQDIDEAVARNNEYLAKIEVLLRENNLTLHSNGVHIAEIVEQFTRQSRTVDPKKYRSHVTADDFWKSIKVSIAEAEMILTEKELNAISDIVEAKSNGYSLKVKRINRRTRK